MITEPLLRPAVRHQAGTAKIGNIPVRRVLLLVVLLAVASGSGLALDIGWSRLFPVHLTLLALSGFTLVEMLVRPELRALVDRFEPRDRLIGVAGSCPCSAWGWV